ncbi:MAG: SAM-dependent methyltransferase [Candidatus Eremiobacteraeota bacterium]|nr:SAM-dependent methyltransferase [Candidatus Eremiobacteraeota bacterium]
MTFTVEPIGVVHSARTGRSDEYWGAVESTIELDERFSSEALTGLGEFSHLEVVFLLHGIDESEIETKARHPRNNPAWPKIGIFAQRGARRPNRIGVSRCALLRVEGRTLYVRGLDAIDETPVLDIKPYIREFGPAGDVRQPPWATEVMERYYDINEV